MFGAEFPGKTFQYSLRFLVSAILLFAATSKLQVAPAILRGDSLLSNPYLLYAAIVVETAVAIWALIAPSRLAWSVIMVLFSTLTSFACLAIISNRECNCFGSHLPSATSVPINVTIVAAMFLSRKHWGNRQENIGSHAEANNSRWHDQKPGKLPVNVVVACIASVVAASISGMVLKYTLKSQQENPNIRFLLADNWLGKSWPIDGQFDARLRKLTVGKWLVLVLRTDCAHCNALAKLIDDHDKGAAYGKPQIVSFVAGSKMWPVHFGKASTSLESEIKIQWNGGKEPFVASPAAFFIDDGSIADAKDGDDAGELVERILDMPLTSLK